MMRGKTEKMLVLVVIGLCLWSVARADLAGQVNDILRSQKNVRFSVCIVEADSGRRLYSLHARQAMIPASNMKIITSAAALRFLGPDYEYVTTVGLRGDTLVVIGSGDPLLGDMKTDEKHGREAGWMFDNIIHGLEQRDITVVNDIVIDTGVFDDERVHPSWPREELNRWYACEVSGLNYNGNCIDVFAEKDGARVIVSTRPQTDYVGIINKVTLISSGEQALGSYRTAEANRIIVFGDCKNKIGPFCVAIERPAAFFGFVLAEELRRAGIEVDGQIIEKTSTDPYEEDVAEYRTSIADCLTRCNRNSLGLAAEALVKTIAANGNPDKRNGSWQGGRELISQYLQDLGVEKDEFHIEDGSGLNRENRLSANAITKVLLRVYQSNDWQLYRDSLAVGGVSGTIHKYFEESPYKGKIFGKTGYIRGVKSLSGVCSTGQGDYIFSILANKANARTRRAINDIAKAIFDSR
jgi:D-alanyl-D-alanine carboxypeptidase/D-alanyl-D-alanine-endopeptidase (penicillin-binding protein 4)